MKENKKGLKQTNTRVQTACEEDNASWVMLYLSGGGNRTTQFLYASFKDSRLEDKCSWDEEQTEYYCTPQYFY